MGGRLTFGLLGPVQIWSDDQPVTAGPTRQRAVLATLLLHANRVTPVDDIVDLLWGDDPPRTARKNVQLHVWRLRQVVGDRLTSDPPGYRIAVAPDDLDVSRFEALLESGRAAVRSGLTARAATLYRSALDLWRGAPLADVAGLGGFGRSVAWLDRRRLTAYEEYVDVGLDLGRYDEVLTLLDELVTRYPLHERFAEQQVVTLHHRGRRSEAVDAYRRYRRALAEELMMEPGPVLHRLAELARQPEPAAGAPSRSEGRVVRELPRSTATLVGRDRALAELRDALTARPRPAGPVHVVTGPAGVGKSALAVRAAHQVAGHFPDGQLYVDLRGATAGVDPLPPSAVLGRFLRVLGVREAAIPTDLAEAAAALRSLLAGRRMLLVLDNAHDAGQLRPLIPASDECAVLATSRRKLTDVDGAGHLELDVLDDTDAVDLLRALAGGDRVDAQADVAARLVRRLGGLPLAVRIAAARLAARPAWNLATLDDRLRDEHRRLHELRQGDIAVRTSFLVSYEHLTHPLAARLFRLVGALDGTDVTREVAAALLDVEPLQALDALDDSLFLFFEMRGHVDDWICVDRAGVAAAERLGDPVAQARLLHDLAVAHFHRNRTDEATRLLRRGLEISDAAGDDEGQARALNQLGVLHGMAGEYDESADCFKQSLRLRRRLGDVRSCAATTGNIGMAYRLAGRYEEAVRFCRTAVRLARLGHAPEIEANALGNLGEVQCLLGHYHSALRYLRRSLAVAGVPVNERNRGSMMGTLADASLGAGQAEAAVRYAELAVAAMRQAEFRHGEAVALRRLGLMLCRSGEVERGVQQLRLALAVFTDLGSPEADEVRAELRSRFGLPGASTACRTN